MVPYRVIPRNGKIICLAGIWEENGVDRNGKPIISFSMITREAYRPVSDLNGLMPVVLEQGKELKWLKDDLEIDEIIDKIEIEDWALLRYYPVSPKIGNIALDSPDLIKEARTSDQHGNYTLFP